MKNEKIIFVGFFSGKYGKMSKKVKNDEKGSDIAEKGPSWWKMKKIIFVGFFSGQHGTMSKKVKNDEKGSDIAEKGLNWWKMKKSYLWDFFRKMWNNVEKSEKWWKMFFIYCWKRLKLMKNEKRIFIWIFSGKCVKMSKKVKNDEKGSDIAEKA